MSLYSVENKVFKNLILYGSMTVAKMLIMAPLTAYFRFTRNSFANIEDAAPGAKGDAEKLKRSLVLNDDVERVRRCHLNDIENIIPFVLLGIMLVGVNPNAETAIMHFKVFFYSRLLHTLVYVGKVRQPARGLSWMIGYCTCFSMAYQIIKAVW